MEVGLSSEVMLVVQQSSPSLLMVLLLLLPEGEVVPLLALHVLPVGEVVPQLALHGSFPPTESHWTLAIVPSLSSTWIVEIVDDPSFPPRRRGGWHLWPLNIWTLTAVHGETAPSCLLRRPFS